MSADDAKVWVDLLATLLTASGFGGIVLAMLGVWRSKMERPAHIAPPQVGGGALAQIGGMVMGQQTAQDIINALQSIASSHDRCTLTREAEMAARKKEVEETREHEKRLLEERRHHEKRLAEERHQEHREMVEAIQGLTRGARDIRCAG